MNSLKTKFLSLVGCLAVLIQLPCPAQPTSSSGSAPGSELEAGFSGKVLETTNAAGYTYVQVDAAGKKVRAATTQFEVKVGDSVTVAAGTTMPGFHSKALNRDFDQILFSGHITVAGGPAPAPTPAPVLPPGHPPIGGEATATPKLPPGHPPLTGAGAGATPNLDLTGIKKADGGMTIQEIYAAKNKLAGKPVVVRGKVVKYNAMILGKNWLHIQDGSGSADKGDNDLTITTATPSALGAIVLVTGNISTNRDFGAGYKYSVIIEDGTVTGE